MLAIFTMQTTPFIKKKQKKNNKHNKIVTDIQLEYLCNWHNVWFMADVFMITVTDVCHNRLW